MGSNDGEVWSEVDVKLKEVGLKLRRHQYSTTDELVDLLYEGASALSHLGSAPHTVPTRKALPYLAFMLEKDELMLHTDINVQIALAVCFVDLSRISAPFAPIPDENVTKMFPLFMAAIQQLSCESPSWQPGRVLKYMAMSQSCLMMLDFDESGQSSTEMFRLFLNIIRSDHSPEIFEAMQKIMTMMIEEIKDEEPEEIEILNQFLNVLLASVKMDNKNLSPMSWELGKSVFEICATKLQPYLKEAVKSMNLKIDDYAEIVISLCGDTSNGENMNQEETEALPTLQPGGVEESKSDENLSETQECCDQILQLNSNNATSSNGNSVETVEADVENGIMKNKRGRKPKSRYDDLEWSSSVRRTIFQRKVKKGSSSKGKIQCKKEEEVTLSHSNNELLIEEGSGRRDTVISQLQQESKDDVEKNPGSYVGDYGEDLVNSRIQVWWPDDKTFYRGTITAFDRIKEEHMVLYDDDQIENLDLRNEIWEPLNYRQPQETQSSLKGKEVTIHPSPAKESVKTLEKTAVKRKGRPPNKQHASSSSKRPKSESNGRRLKSGENSVRAVIHVKDEPEQETRATNVSSKVEREKRAVKDEPKTLMKNRTLKNQAGPSSLTSQRLNKGYNPKHDPYYGFL